MNTAPIGTTMNRITLINDEQLGHVVIPITARAGLTTHIRMRAKMNAKTILATEVSSPMITQLLELLLAVHVSVLRLLP